MIAYRVLGVYSGYSSCYGSIGAVIQRGQEANPLKRFRGIRLYFSTEAYEKDKREEETPIVFHNMNDTTRLFKESQPKKDILDTLQIARSLGFGNYLKDDDEEIYNDGYVDFSPDVPFVVVVTMTGFFRWYDNHKYLLDIYRLLSRNLYRRYAKRAKAVGYDDQIKRPFGRRSDMLSVPKAVAVFLAANAVTFKDGSIVRGGKLFYPQKIKSLKNLAVLLHTTHSVVPGTSFSWVGLTHMSDWQKRLHHLETMRAEYRRTKKLSYFGRDSFFSGQNTTYGVRGGSFYRHDPRLMLTQSLAYSFLPKEAIDKEENVVNTGAYDFDANAFMAFIERLDYGENIACRLT